MRDRTAGEPHPQLEPARTPLLDVLGAGASGVWARLDRPSALALRSACRAARDAHDAAAATLSIRGQRLGGCPAQALAAMRARGCRPRNLVFDVAVSAEAGLDMLLASGIGGDASALTLQGPWQSERLEEQPEAMRAALPHLVQLQVRANIPAACPSGDAVHLQAPQQQPLQQADTPYAALLRAAAANLVHLTLEFQEPHDLASMPRDLPPILTALRDLTIVLGPPLRSMDGWASCSSSSSVWRQLGMAAETQNAGGGGHRNAADRESEERQRGEDDAHRASVSCSRWQACLGSGELERHLEALCSIATLRSLQITGPGAGAFLGQHSLPFLAALRALPSLTRLGLPRAAMPDARGKGGDLSYGIHASVLFAPPSGLASRLVELDLGPGSILTLPHLLHAAAALTRLCAGELSSEHVCADQWSWVAQPPPQPTLLPQLVEGRAPPHLYERAPYGCCLPLCCLPLPAVRLPPRLRSLTVRFLPDMAILAALAALPRFTEVRAVAVHAPDGEVSLDVASVGLAGPPDLRYRSSLGDGPADWVPGMVEAAAGLLLRVLRDEDWRRHPLTLRPSPLSSLAPGFAALRWAGPHAPWLSALSCLRHKVRRLRIKQVDLQLEDGLALVAALPDLRELELVNCGASRRHVQAWQEALGAGGVVRVGGDGGALYDMFASSDDDERD